MSSQILIPILFIVFCWLIYQASKRQPERFSFSEVLTILGVRVLLGFLYGYIFAKYFNGDDTWYFHKGSIEEQAKLLSNPLQFLADFNPYPAFQRNESWSAGWYYYLSDLEFWLLTKPMAIFNLITNGNYYANVVCFNFLLCWGSIWLFRFFNNTYPNRRRLVFFSVFILPVPLFWMTGIRAEGWLLLFIAGALLSFERLTDRIKLGNLLWFLASIIGILILRSMLLFLLLPTMLCWWIQVKKGWRPWKPLALVFGLGLLVFFGSTLLDANANLPNIIIKRQAAFFALNGQTRIPLDTLSNQPQSFLKIFPQAVGNSFVRPFIWEAKGWLQVISSFSTMFLLVLIFAFFIRPRNSYTQLYAQPASFYPAVFAVLLYLFIGYTIPFPGAIIRYKSIGEWFLVVPLILSIRWKNTIKL